MTCCFINGSPKGTTGNTEIFIQAMRRGMKQSSDVVYVVKEDPNVLAKRLLTYDRLILVMPLYVFAMPGIVLALMEEMTSSYKGIEVGVIIQQGFNESKHSRHLKAYMLRWIEEIQATSLGCVIRGGSAGFCFMPEKMYHKVAIQLETLGSYLECHGEFQKDIVAQFEIPYAFTPSKGFLYRRMSALGLTNLFWNKMLKSNHAYEQRYDRPYE